MGMAVIAGPNCETSYPAACCGLVAPNLTLPDNANSEVSNAGCQCCQLRLGCERERYAMNYEIVSENKVVAAAVTTGPRNKQSKMG
jgi:hypothetical protein